mmetsp:Transcript_12357/g.37998  ORF Transcript_12357/g.37998 Transcript_12357/m.37998 type:complete len:248 (-) Transcript_12357:136-879(-)
MLLCEPRWRRRPPGAMLNNYLLYKLYLRFFFPPPFEPSSSESDSFSSDNPKRPLIIFCGSDELLICSSILLRSSGSSESINLGMKKTMSIVKPIIRSMGLRNNVCKPGCWRLSKYSNLTCGRRSTGYAAARLFAPGYMYSRTRISPSSSGRFSLNCEKRYSVDNTSSKYTPGATSVKRNDPSGLVKARCSPPFKVTSVVRRSPSCNNFSGSLILPSTAWPSTWLALAAAMISALARRRIVGAFVLQA